LDLFNNPVGYRTSLLKKGEKYFSIKKRGSPKQQGQSPYSFEIVPLKNAALQGLASFVKHGLKSKSQFY
jgi:hypothetical protein